MARDSQRLEQEFIATCAEKTGKTLDEWMTLLAQSGESKQNALIKWIKSEHGLNHMQAAFLAGIYLNDGKPVYDYEVLFARLFEDKPHLLPAYEAVAALVTEKLDDVVCVPTKTYISIEGKKCFACVTPTKKTLRVGMDLDQPFDDYVQKGKSLGAMPNITHMIEISDPGEVDDRMLNYMQQAYDRTHA
ncbi:MAG: DUF4287 domain-containing protein [Anaerolineae bacterium]|nr:DUF4287 domain-containing protein [Anaerolineae bacterium]